MRGKRHIYSNSLKIIEGSGQKKNNSPQGSLLVIFDFAISFQGFEKAGLLSRTLKHYERYSENFHKVYMRTIDNQRFNQLPSNFEPVPFIRMPNRRLTRLAYFLSPGFLLPRQVNYVEVRNEMAIIPALIYKFRGARIFLYFTMDSVATFRAQHRGRFKAMIFSGFCQLLAFKIGVNTSTQTSRRLLVAVDVS